MSTMKKKRVIKKSFRLFDFHVYDGSLDEGVKEESNSDSSSDDKSTDSNDKVNRFIIQMFGINETGETCCLYVKDYLPFFFIKVDDSWTDYTVKQFMQHLKKKQKLKTVVDSIVSCKLVEHEKLYGFSGGKMHKFMKISFTNQTAMKRVKHLWYIFENNEKGEFIRKRQIDYYFKDTKLELYESNLLPLLRCFHIYTISPSGWVSFKTNKTNKPTIPTTTCKFEYIISIKDIDPQNDKETIVPYNICSYDIEASSSHGDFPVPKKDYKRLATNIVDLLLPKLEMYGEESQLTQLLKLIILTAFNFGKIKDVDNVFPKKIVNKENIEYRINMLLNNPFEQAKHLNREEDNSELVKINDMFDQMHSFQQSQGETNEEIDQGNDCEEVQRPKFVYRRKGPKVNKKDKLIHILISEEYKRDEKIQLTNEILTYLFPPLEGDKVTFIGSTFLKYGENEPYLNHCVVLGSCDPIEGCEIECYEKEKDVLLAWTNIIQRENPDIVIGYNIFGFDYSFMFNRSEELDCTQEFLQLSRVQNEVAASLVPGTVNQYRMDKTLLKIASGEYDLQYYKMKGRLQIDMYAYFRRDFNLSSYKLDDVSGQFISDSVKHVEYKEFENNGMCSALYSKNLMGLHAGDFIHIELSSFTSDY